MSYLEVSYIISQYLLQPMPHELVWLESTGTISGPKWGTMRPLSDGPFLDLGHFLTHMSWSVININWVLSVQPSLLYYSVHPSLAAWSPKHPPPTFQFIESTGICLGPTSLSEA